MKKNLFILMAFVCLFSSCSKDDDEITGIVPTEEFGNKYAGDLYGYGLLDEVGVRVWSEFEMDKIKVSRHVCSPFDKGVEPTIGHEVFYLCDDTSNVSVKWISNSNIVRVDKNEIWIESLKKWQVSSVVCFEPTILKDLYLEAYVEFPDTTVRRCCIYPEIEVYDYDFFNFGTHRSEIKIKKDLSFTMSVAAEAINGSTTLLEFKDDKLVKIYSINIPSSGDIIFLGERCNIPEKLQITNPATDFMIANPQEWTFGELKFKAFNIDLTAYDLGIQACISVELK
ncbi:MAG: hypothetical protein LBV72_07625 [Tannerella sp.]|jgi:hypothetical protein|nr:hypothetical protein [Tannerella sp.]